MAALLRRLATAAPALRYNVLCGQSKIESSKFRFPIGTFTAVAGGISYMYYAATSNLVYLAPNSEEDGQKVALKPDTWIAFELQDIARVSHNTKLFRFSCDPTEKLGLDVASCIVTRAPIDKDEEGKVKYVQRSYTPISDPEAKGYFDLLIKIYPQGKMTQHFASLKPGDTVEMKGPIHKLKYSPNMKKHIGMIAGGTGITPMLQVIDAIAKNPDDITQVSLIFANMTPNDILLKQKLDILATSHPNIKVFYIVSNPSKGWKGGKGYVSKDMIIKCLPPPGNDSLILVCGPPGMMKHVCGPKAKDFSQGELGGLLKDLGYSKEMVFKF